MLLSIALIATPVILFLHAFAEFATPVTDPNQYQPILKTYRDDFARSPADADVLAYFPDSIPPEASQVRFDRHLVPGDMGFELNCVLPQAEVTALAARVSPAAIAATHGSAIPESGAAGEISSPWFGTGDIPGRSYLSDAFTIYILGIGHGNKNDKEESHWTYEYGVAIDPTHNDVIYWLNGSAH